jgi:Fe2+ transport system protein FeoA
VDELNGQPVSLAEVPAGQRVRVVSLTGGMESEKRLLDMGVDLNSEVEVIVAGKRSPVLLAVGETRLALEPDLAWLVQVQYCAGCGSSRDQKHGRRHGRERRRHGWRFR